MRTSPNNIGMFFTASIFSTFFFMLFAPQQMHAYFASDFVKQLDGDARQVRRVLTKGVTSTNQSRFVLQHGRANNSNITVSSTDKYLANLKGVRDSSRLTDSVSRSNQVMDICREKYPNRSIICFTRNRRLAQRMDVVITYDKIRASIFSEHPLANEDRENQISARIQIPVALSPRNSQRARSDSDSLRVYSTDKYLASLQETRISSRFTQSASRSNQVMDICSEKYPATRMRCFTRNRRLVQRSNVPVTAMKVR